MVASYDKKIYEFITQPDNWQVAREVYEKMDYVKGQLVEEFWAEVKKAIKYRVDLKEWKIGMSEDIYENYSKLRISHISWNNLFDIAFQELEDVTFLGVYRDFESKKVPDDLHQQIGMNLKTVDNRLINPDDWWTGYFFTGDNFSQLSSLDKILPSNRKSYIDKYSTMLLELKDKAKPIIDKAIKNLK